MRTTEYGLNSVHPLFQTHIAHHFNLIATVLRTIQFKYNLLSDKTITFAGHQNYWVM